MPHGWRKANQVMQVILLLVSKRNHVCRGVAAHENGSSPKFCLNNALKER